MGTTGLEHADLAARVPKGHEVLAKQAQLYRVAIGRREVRGRESGDPEAAQEFSHGRAGANST